MTLPNLSRSMLAALSLFSSALTLAAPITFNATGGIQSYTVTASGQYVIAAAGAQGGSSNNGSQGGLGALLQDVFTLTAGDTLSILVGHQGNGPGQFFGTGGGGGGGTYVVRNGSALLVAGGGGGAGGEAIGSGNAGVGGVATSTAGTAGLAGGTPWSTAIFTGVPGAGGVNGGGGGLGTNPIYSNFFTLNWENGGGGGFLGNGSGPGGGASYVNGSAGGSSNGGFGGGGGSSFAPGGGGGGGYSGGGGGATTPIAQTTNAGGGGGGGGSFNALANYIGFGIDPGYTSSHFLALDAHNPGHGWVELTRLTSVAPVPEPQALILMLLGLVPLAARRRRLG